MAAVAVIIPAYNPGHYLRTALASVVHQTVEDWECVVVDDGSDEDLGWVTTVDPRVRLHRQQNAGTSAARNAGLSLTSAPLVAYLDQDDEWAPAKLDRQIRSFDDSRIGVCDTNARIVRGGVQIAHGYVEHRGTYDGLIAGGSMILSTVMARREAIVASGGFNPCLRIMQDYDLYLRITLLGWRAERIEEELATYRLHESNTSSDYWRAVHEHRTVLAEHRFSASGQALRAGQRWRRRTYGAQAFDAFRATRRPIHLMRALAMNPRTVYAQLGRKLTGP